MTTAVNPIDALACCVYIPKRKFFEALAGTAVYAPPKSSSPWDDWNNMAESNCFEDALFGSADACLVLHTRKLLGKLLTGMEFIEDEAELMTARNRFYLALTALMWPGDTRIQLR